MSFGWLPEGGTWLRLSAVISAGGGTPCNGRRGLGLWLRLRLRLWLWFRWWWRIRRLRLFNRDLRLLSSTGGRIGRLT
jgi:hypothetical protein